MKNILVLFIAAIGGVVFPAQAKTLMETCPDLPACLKAVSELTGEKYVTSLDNLKCGYKATDNLALTRENADLLFTGILNQCALSRVPFGGQDIYRIERINEAKGMNVPSYPCTHEQAPQIPETWDIVRMEYKMTHPESVKHLENLVRTYANMGARIYGYDADGTLVITETGIALRDLYKFVRARDVAVSPALVKKWGEEEKRWHEERMLEKRAKANEKPEPAAAPAPKPDGKSR